MVAIGTFVDVKKYATDVLGNLYEVKDNNLKLEFKQGTIVTGYNLAKIYMTWQNKGLSRIRLL